MSPRPHAMRVPVAPALALAALLLSPATNAQTPPTAHHPGAWSDSSSWPGNPNVQAIHMALVRGDTLFTRPHSQVLAWGSWTANTVEGFADNGGRWGWAPAFDGCAQSPGNLSPLSLDRPPFNPFCSAHAATPQGDLLIVGGHERTIAGEKRALRFDRESGTWATVPDMAAARWYANATMLPETQGRILATAGIQFDIGVLFGGRRGDDALTSNVERYAFTDNGVWQPTLSGSGPGWPTPREYHSLAHQPLGPYFLFGGKASNGLRNDAWKLERADSDNDESYAWQPISPSGGIPEARWQHAAVVDQPFAQSLQPTASMYVFGGEDASG